MWPLQNEGSIESQIKQYEQLPDVSLLDLLLQSPEAIMERYSAKELLSPTPPQAISPQKRTGLAAAFFGQPPTIPATAATQLTPEQIERLQKPSWTEGIGRTLSVLGSVAALFNPALWPLASFGTGLASGVKNAREETIQKASEQEQQLENRRATRTEEVSKRIQSLAALQSALAQLRASALRGESDPSLAKEVGRVIAKARAGFKLNAADVATLRYALESEAAAAWGIDKNALAEIVKNLGGPTIGMEEAPTRPVDPLSLEKRIRERIEMLRKLK